MSLYAIVKRNEPSILGIFYYMAIVYIHRRKPRRISENCRNQRPKRKYQYKWEYIN